MLSLLSPQSLSFEAVLGHMWKMTPEPELDDVKQ